MAHTAILLVLYSFLTVGLKVPRRQMPGPDPAQLMHQGAPLRSAYSSSVPAGKTAHTSWQPQPLADPKLLLASSIGGATECVLSAGVLNPGGRSTSFQSRRVRVLVYTSNMSSIPMPFQNLHFRLMFFLFKQITFPPPPLQNFVSKAPGVQTLGDSSATLSGGRVKQALLGYGSMP